MTKLIALSDTHLRKIEIEPCDVLIHSGDLTFKGSVIEIYKALTWLSSLPAIHKILVPGNHDWLAELQEPLFREMCKERNITPLINESVIIEGIKFYGSPAQPAFCKWAFNYERGQQLKQFWDMIPNDTDVLVTHTPAYGFGDHRINGERAGCADLLEAIRRVKPKYHVFGHIHNGYGIYQGLQTTFINASICDEEYKASNSPVTFEIYKTTN